MGDTKELAVGYTRANTTQSNAGLFLLERLALIPGMQVLDVGCGPGNLTAHIAALVGSAGTVTGIDPSAERIALASQLTTPSLSFHVGVAEDLSRFPTATFDALFVNSTLHWVRDQPAALREFARVLKPGGRLGVSGGSGDFRSAQERIKADVLAREQYSRYEEEAPPKFLGRAELEGLLRDAGFGTWEIVVNRIVKEVKNADEMIDWLDTSSSGKTYGGIPLELRPQAREEMKREWEKMATEEGISMEMELLVTVAVRA